jgi:hypothetical protein
MLENRLEINLSLYSKAYKTLEFSLQTPIRLIIWNTLIDNHTDYTLSKTRWLIISPLSFSIFPITVYTLRWWFPSSFLHTPLSLHIHVHLGSPHHPCMKWPRYRRVISLEIQVGITSRIHKWANTDPRKYKRWDQVPRRSKHPVDRSHPPWAQFHYRECGVICCQSQCVKCGLTIGMKNVRQYMAQGKFVMMGIWWESRHSDMK